MNTPVPDRRVAYIMAHGAYREGDRTFVPHGKKVHLYTRPGETLATALGLAVLGGGDIPPWRTFQTPNDAEIEPVYVENVLFSPKKSDEVGWYLATQSSATPQGDLYLLGFTPDPHAPFPNMRELDVDRLCTGSCKVMSRTIKDGFG